MKITENALQKIFDLFVDTQDVDLFFRIGVIGGGCSGFQYTMTFDNQHQDDDIVVAQHENLVCKTDYISLQYLSNATIDYIDDGLNSQFLIKNPQAVRTCGCGHSFEAE